MSSDLLTGVQDGVAFITFNRPEFRNAISSQMLADATAFVGSLAGRSGVRCLVIRGEGAHFSGGGDVRNFSGAVQVSSAERQAQFSGRVMASKTLFESLEALPVPVIAVVRGAVAGGGLGFTLAADLAIASDTAFFLVAHGRLGLAIDTALSYHLVRAVGLRRAKELTLLAERLNAAQALDYGIVCRVFPDAELDAAADAIIATLATGATLAHGQSKLILQSSLDNSVGRQVELEAQAVGVTAASDDFVEGVTAFMERRPAAFQGR